MTPSATPTELTSLGRGTPKGERLRRYWQPVGRTADATDIPRKVRVLGEDMVLFRNRPRCREVKFEMPPSGVTERSIRRQDDGKVFYHVTEAALATLRMMPNPRVVQFARVGSIGWTRSGSIWRAG